MEDFEEKLNTILSSPEAMGQIMALANSLSGTPKEEVQESGAPSESNRDSPLGFLSGLDPNLIRKASTLLDAYTHDNDQRIALLAAMSPFLSEERRPQLEKAMQIARLARVIRYAFREFGGDSFV